MVSIVGSISGSLRGLISLCKAFLLSNKSHLFLNRLVDPLGIKILEL